MPLFQVRLHRRGQNKKRLRPSYGTKALLLLCHPRILSSSFPHTYSSHTRSLYNRRRSRQLLLGVTPFVCPHKSIQSILHCRFPPSAALCQLGYRPTILNHRFKKSFTFYMISFYARRLVLSRVFRNYHLVYLDRSCQISAAPKHSPQRICLLTGFLKRIRHKQQIRACVLKGDMPIDSFFS